MRHARPALAAALIAALGAALPTTPARADSRHSDTVTECFNGVCTRTERFVVEDRWGRRGWERRRTWDDDDDDEDRGWRRPRHGYGYGPPPGAVIILPPIILGR